MTPEQAAELCAQKTAKLYSINIPDGAEIDLRYSVNPSSVTEGNQWWCLLYTDKENTETGSCYSMSIDSVTGEIYKTFFSPWANLGDRIVYGSPEDKEESEKYKPEEHNIDERCKNTEYAKAANDFVKRLGFTPISADVSVFPGKGGDDESYIISFGVEIKCEGGGIWVMEVGLNSYSIYNSFYYPNGYNE